MTKKHIIISYTHGLYFHLVAHMYIQINVLYGPFKFPKLLQFYLGVCKPTCGSSNESVSNSQSSKISIASKCSFKHWNYNSNHAWKDYLSMAYILTMLKYNLWLILIVFNAFQATFLPTIAHHDLLIWQRCHNIEGGCKQDILYILLPCFLLENTKKNKNSNF
jgi:hypothetical protein